MTRKTAPRDIATGERLRLLRQDILRITSQAAFAEQIGVTRGAVGNWELGKGIKRENLQAISTRFNVPFEWLATGQGRQPKLSDWDPAAPDPVEDNDQMLVGQQVGRRGLPEDASALIDVTAGMGGGGLTLISDGVPGQRGMTFAAEHVRDYWRLPPAILSALGLRASDVSIFMVQGDSMHPTINEGDFVFVDTRHRWPSPDGLYALSDPFGGIVVKRLEVEPGPAGEEPGVRIISDNPRHAPKLQTLEETRIIGRVLRRFGVIA